MTEARAEETWYTESLVRALIQDNPEAAAQRVEAQTTADDLLGRLLQLDTPTALAARDAYCEYSYQRPTCQPEGYAGPLPHDCNEPCTDDLPGHNGPHRCACGLEWPDQWLAELAAWDADAGKRPRA